MKLSRDTSSLIRAPREHVVANLVRTDLETVRFYDPRVESVETNGLPDGAEGQEVRLTARVWGQEVELVQTTLTAELPDYLADRMDMPGDSLFTETWLTDGGDGTTRIAQQVTYEIPAWNVFKLAITALTARSQLRKALARFVELTERRYNES